jgi:TATA-binding protein-associated factor
MSYIKSLDSFTNWLLARLFEPEWEIRHGAATSLREVAKKLVNALFSVSNLKNDERPPIAQLQPWFDTLLFKLFKVVALDRFADYIGDEVVAPVRETCTQTIGVISKLYTLDSAETKRICNLINMFFSTHSSNVSAVVVVVVAHSTGGKSNWEVQHSGIMILKYTIAAALASGTSTLREIFSQTFDHVLDCIQNTDDDVRQMASSSLEPVSQRLNALLDNDAAKLERLMQILLDVLSDLDDLGRFSKLKWKARLSFWSISREIKVQWGQLRYQSIENIHTKNILIFLT